MKNTFLLMSLFAVCSSSCWSQPVFSVSGAVNYSVIPSYSEIQPGPNFLTFLDKKENYSLGIGASLLAEASLHLSKRWYMDLGAGMRTVNYKRTLYLQSDIPIYYTQDEEGNFVVARQSEGAFLVTGSEGRSEIPTRLTCLAFPIRLNYEPVKNLRVGAGLTISSVIRSFQEKNIQILYEYNEEDGTPATHSETGTVHDRTTNDFFNLQMIGNARISYVLIKKLGIWTSYNYSFFPLYSPQGNVNLHLFETGLTYRLSKLADD